MSPAHFIDDPNWSDFIPELTESARQRHLPSHEDCSPVDVGSAAGHLMRGGTLGRMPGYEERRGQIDMLKAVMQAFDDGAHLMIEAGTGVGKSLAYLIPSILWSWTNDTPVVVSTATRNLQSQLIGSDIPKALEILGDDAGKFKVALLKGRANYLCLRAVAEFFSSGYWTMDAAEQAEMPHFIEWLQTTPDGDLDGYEGLPRGLITCPGEECGGRKCRYWSRCFVYKARKRAADAHLVIVNHALALAEATSDGGGILPAYARLVLDEAHNLEDIATEFLSRELSLPVLTRILNRLHRRGKGRRAQFSGGVLANVDRQLSKGALAGNPAAAQIAGLMADAVSAIPAVTRATSALIDVAEGLLAPAQDRGICRYRGGEGPRAYSLHGAFKSYEDWDESALGAAQDRFEGIVAKLVNKLHELAKALDDSVVDGEFNWLGDLSSQLVQSAESLISFANDANFVLSGAKDTHAYWIERMRAERRASHLRLVAAPLSVAESLRNMLYRTKDTVVLSSATLRVGNDFRYMASRLGFAPGEDDAPDRYRMLTAQSPFDYLRQAEVLAPDCLPDPAEQPAEYAEALAALLKDLFSATDGRALVLFTSYEMMNAVADRVREVIAGSGISLLVQGEGLSRESMTHALKAGHRTVLFGAQSFWEGVDVAGEALSCVVLARLPFLQVGDPVVEARCERIDREGGSSFRDYSLPQAVIRFRQGFGRLIRSRSDRGVVIITDPRVVTKNYGGVFRRSIPTSVHTVTAVSELMRRVTDFFG